MRAFAIISMLAWRNLWRNHRRTIVMVSAITIGVWAMIFMTALMRGMVNDMIRDGIRTLPGHVQVHHPEFRDDPSINEPYPDVGFALTEAFSKADLDGWSSSVKVPAIISSERESRGVTLIGVDPALERSTWRDRQQYCGRAQSGRSSTTAVSLSAGSSRTSSTPNWANAIVLMSQDPDNEIADRGYRVVGLFEANLEQHEEAFVFAGKATVQKMLGSRTRSAKSPSWRPITAT